MDYAGDVLASGTIPEDDEMVEGMLLDPPDPLDLLIAHTESGVMSKSRPLDFVRAKFQEVKAENRRLKERVADLEQTLSIVQTAQEWTIGRGMTQEQKDKMKEIRGLLEQAKKAREDIQSFSGASRQAMYEKLRDTKAALKRERQEKQEMKDRLLHAFDHARAIKDQHRRLSQQRINEQEKWQDIVRDTKERHRRELRRLQGDGAVMEADRQDQLSYFGEQVIDGLNALQQHIGGLKQETVDSVIFEGGPEDDAPFDDGAGGGGYDGGADAAGPQEDADF
mmetsp:Transcript_126925/g.406429  ORF Transcript_126925/g.406429 Transcript_126925/m.406429 type:complete len:280 (-) Transcript_126925:149-988(-)